MSKPKKRPLPDIVKMVERVIKDLELSPSECRLSTDDPAWGLAKGSAEVFVFINPGEPDQGDEFFIQCISPVMKLPKSEHNRNALLHKLLQLNAEELAGAAFGLKGEDTVVLIADRSTIDLDPSEVKDMVLRVGYYADVYDDQLVNEFGGKRHSD